jgi:hypothetical protein
MERDAEYRADQQRYRADQQRLQAEQQRLMGLVIATQQQHDARLQEHGARLSALETKFEALLQCVTSGDQVLTNLYQLLVDRDQSITEILRGVLGTFNQLRNVQRDQGIQFDQLLEQVRAMQIGEETG